MPLPETGSDFTAFTARHQERTAGRAGGHVREDEVPIPRCHVTSLSHRGSPLQVTVYSDNDRSALEWCESL